MRWGQREGAERFAERRRKEDEAPRLLSVAPKLRSLKFEIEERRAGSSLIETAHVRPIVVPRAPAMFFFPCQDSNCKDGGHEVTGPISIALRARKERFEGEDRCVGHAGSADCGRVLRYVGIATYEPI